MIKFKDEIIVIEQFSAETPIEEVNDRLKFWKENFHGETYLEGKNILGKGKVVV